MRTLLPHDGVAATTSDPGVIHGSRSLELHLELRDPDIPLMVLGEPGGAKTAIVSQFCKNKGHLYVVWCAAHHTVLDTNLPYIGEHNIIRSGKPRALEIALQEWADRQKELHKDDPDWTVPHVTVILDEFSDAAPSEKKVYGQWLLDPRSIGEHAIGDHVDFVLIGNRMQDGPEVQENVGAIQNRIEVIEYHQTLEDHLAYSERVGEDERIRNFLRRHPTCFRTFDPDKLDEPFGCSRSWSAVAEELVHFDTTARVLGLSEAKRQKHLLTQLAGRVGKDNANKMLDYLLELEKRERIVSQEEIEINGSEDLCEFLETNDPNQPAYITGPPGTGKTEIASQFIQSKGRDCIIWRAAHRDALDLNVPMLSDDAFIDYGVHSSLVPCLQSWVDRERVRQAELGNPDWQPTPVTVLLDEFSDADPAMKKVYGQWLFGDDRTPRNIGGHAIGKHVNFIILGNEINDGPEVQDDPAAITSRTVRVRYRPDAKQWCRWAENHNVDKTIVKFIYLDDGKYFQSAPDDNGRFGSARSWTRLSQALQEMERRAKHIPDLKPNELETHRMAKAVGLVGHEPAMHFMAFLAVHKDVDADGVLADPMGADTLEGKSFVRYVLLEKAMDLVVANFDKEVGRDGMGDWKSLTNLVVYTRRLKDPQAENLIYEVMNNDRGNLTPAMTAAAVMNGAFYELTCDRAIRELAVRDEGKRLRDLRQQNMAAAMPRP